MRNAVADYLMSLPKTAAVIISVAAMLFLGFLMTRVTNKLKLPSVTAYIITGVLIGPYCLNVIPQTVVTGTEFLSDIAVAFIAFSTGEFFKFSALKKNGSKVIVITLFEAVIAAFAVFILTYFMLDLPVALCIVLAALASTTAPASTAMTIRQTGAKGDYVDTLLQVIALDDIVGLLSFSVAASVAASMISGAVFSAGEIVRPLVLNIGVLLLGCVFGLVMKLTIQNRSSKDNRLIIAIALLFLFCGICAIMDISPLLGCMSMGAVYVNVAEDDKLFKQLNYFSPPILLLFFVRSGLVFDLEALVEPAGEIGSVPLIVIGVLYFLVRIVGKYAGAFVGCICTKRPKNIRNYLGLALIPQASVAIGLAAIGSRTLSGEIGSALQTIILASSVLYELAGPACAKLSLYLSGSYSNKLEDIVEVSELTETGEQKTGLDMLIERINKIQEELPAYDINEEEQAFTKAAEEQYEAVSYDLRRRWMKRRQK